MRFVSVKCCGAWAGMGEGKGEGEGREQGRGVALWEMGDGLPLAKNRNLKRQCVFFPLPWIKYVYSLKIHDTVASELHMLCVPVSLDRRSKLLPTKPDWCLFESP